jgi:hypothetical protein
MTTNEINKQLHEALEKCWHEPEILHTTVKNISGIIGTTTGFGSWICKKCHRVINDCSNPDYCADPRLVIEAMMERPDFALWMAHLEYIGDNIEATDWDHTVDIDLIMDKTGKLALLAIEWMRKEKVCQK